jgi:hypothetical protein
MRKMHRKKWGLQSTVDPKPKLQDWSSQQPSICMYRIGWTWTYHFREYSYLTMKSNGLKWSRLVPSHKKFKIWIGDWCCLCCLPKCEVINQLIELKLYIFLLNFQWQRLLKIQYFLHFVCTNFEISSIKSYSLNNFQKCCELKNWK